MKGSGGLPKTSKARLESLVTNSTSKQVKKEHFNLSDIIAQQQSKQKQNNHGQTSLTKGYLVLAFGENKEETRPVDVDLLKIHKKYMESQKSENKDQVDEEDDIKDNSCSSEGEKLSRIFNVERQYTLAPKISYDRFSASKDKTDPELERSMLTEELRTLSFLNESGDFDDQISDFTENKNINRQKKNKSKLKKSSLRYKGNRKYTLNEISKPPSEILNKRKKGLSLISTQDSRNHLNASVGNRKTIGYLQEERGYKTHLQSIREFHYGEEGPSFYDPYARVNHFCNNPQQPKPGQYNSKNEFNVDINRIKEVGKTTLMIRNIPNKYTKELMLNTIDRDFKNDYDFFYLPIDFKNKCNVGYAFINFKELKNIKPFIKKFNGKRWELFNSEKVCKINYAKIQGKNECKKHFEKSLLMKQPVG